MQNGQSDHRTPKAAARTGGTHQNEEASLVALGWSAESDESQFAVTPTRFAKINRLSSCQAGVVRFLSRYHFERNPWLIDQAMLITQLMLEFGGAGHARWQLWLQRILGLQLYLAPRIQTSFLQGMSMSTFCVVNGIPPSILLPLGLICHSPTEAHLKEALEAMQRLKRQRRDIW